MRSKILVVALVLLLLAAVPSAFATGIGAAFGLQPVGGLPGSNVMLSLKMNNLPLLGLGFNLGQEVFSFGLTADWWMVNENLVSFINFYLGPGFYLGYQGDLLLGGRLPVGLNVFPIRSLELFLEIAPTLAVRLSDPIVFPEFGLQGAFGLRFWF